MIGSLSASDVANEISMTRSTFKGTYVVVEGETDLRLYSKFIPQDKVRILVAHSKDNVCKAVSISTRRADDRVVGIIDRDLDGLLGTKRVPPLFMTDGRDMESTLMCSQAFDAVVFEYGDGKRMADFESTYGDIRKAIGLSSAYIGSLMYLSYRKGMGLVFKELDHSSFIRKDLSIDVEKMVGQVYSKSKKQNIPVGDMVQELKRYVSSLEDPWALARGHDSVSIFVLGLRNVFGSYNSSRLNDGQVGGALRMACSSEGFSKTTLFKESDSWSRKKGLVLWKNIVGDQS
ncbi:MAG: DUF4435 domain-containing protein [archaeon]|nr:DUF4435 domain-containing protein [archaeon]